ncbi:DUF3592 domain-containing protein [Burkholderia sp. Bp9012]|uniref:DUF3592 domain-containing protein n=1 Tax=Burkholderia sp. Bp9012 TaxID=2184562 RepID=UPI000F597956|nr:DUF3592 domain-containing protein [Burkholderia sp. Bp9012]RQR79221.1 DUF3592 domain-containing protein [Burkholderia sp. Bp9012]
MERNPTVLRYKAIGSALVGACMLICAACGIASTHAFIQASVVVPGQVVALNAGPHHPQISFVTKTGKTISYPQNGFVTLHVGDPVQVRYLPQDPEISATLNQFGALYDTTIFLILMASCFLVVGVGGLIWPHLAY